MEVKHLDEKAQRLLNKSKWTYIMLYLPLFGYTINQDLYLLWAAILVIGGFLYLFKNNLIREDMRYKITLIEIFTTLGLIFLIFSDAMVFIKQVVLLIVVTIIVYTHTKLIYLGKLT